MTPSGNVRVAPSLNVKFVGGVVAENIFAIGDIIEWPEQKMIAKAGKHVDVVKANILAALERDEARKEGRAVKVQGKEYGGFFEIILITFGPVSIVRLQL